MKTSKKIVLSVILAIISLLILIFILIQISSSTNSNTYKGFLTNLDLSVNSFMTKIENNFITQLSTIIAFIFDTIILIIITLIISIFLWLKNNKDNKKGPLLFVITILLTSGLIFLIKNLVQRARPLNSTVYETGFAFPSGHTTMSLVFFGVFTYLILLKNKSKPIKQTILSISIFMIALISFTRLYLNAHWLTDVLGGLALGSFILIIFSIIYETLESKTS